MGYNDSRNDRSDAAATSSLPSFTWGARWKAEWRRKLFDIEEVDGKRIDVSASFARTDLLTRLIKIGLFGWFMEVVIRDIKASEPNEAHYMVTISHWGLIKSLLYFTTSAFNSIVGIREQPDRSKRLPKFRIRVQWGFFGTTASAEILILLLYWVLEYDPSTSEVNYLNVMNHGGAALAVLLEGLILNRTPVRIKQMVFLLGFAFLYIVWSVIHDFTGIGNKNRNDGDPSTDDDAIYEDFSWKNDPSRAAAISLVSFFVLCPLLFTLVWSLSLYAWCWKFDGSNRRYYVDKQSSVVGRSSSANLEQNHEEALGGDENQKQLDGDEEDDDNKSKGVLTLVGIDL